MLKWQRVWALDDLIYADDLNWGTLLKSLKNSEELYYVISQYNWDDGFEFPSLVLDRLDCDLGTILMMFDRIGETPGEEPAYGAYEEDLAAFSKRLRARWRLKDYPAGISYNGSPGTPFKAEWKRRHFHDDVFPSGE